MQNVLDRFREKGDIWAGMYNTANEFVSAVKRLEEYLENESGN